MAPKLTPISFASLIMGLNLMVLTHLVNEELALFKGRLRK